MAAGGKCLPRALGQQGAQAVFERVGGDEEALHGWTVLISLAEMGMSVCLKA